MCARYSIGFTEKQVRDLFNLEEIEPLELRYNVAPTQDVPAVVQEPETGKRHLESFRWGLVPYWADDLRIAQKLINARAETAAEKASFRNALRRRRCLIPADAYYEWLRFKIDGKTARRAFLFRRADGEPMGLAGLW